jgi:hypothetical protein
LNRWLHTPHGGASARPAKRHQRYDIKETA